MLSDTWVHVGCGPALGIMALAGLERVPDTAALAGVHEAVLDENYQVTAERAGKLLALAQTVEL